MRKRQRQSSRSNPLPSDILLTLPELGIDVEKVNKKGEAWAICPNPKHPDRKASWSINLDTGEHYCFSCGWAGNYRMLVETVTRLDNDQTEEWIRKRGGIDVARKKLRGERAYEIQKAEPVTEADLALFDKVIPMWALKDRDIIQESCDAYGTLWDPTEDAWILPVRNPESGALWGWQSKSKRHFLNHPEHLEKGLTLYGYHLLGETAYVEESPLDCNRLWTYSVETAVSGYGVHISDEQMELIIEHPKVKRVVMCMDNDAAGRRVERKIWEEYRHRTRLYFANYDGIEAKDHGEMSPEEIEFSIEHPISALRFRP
jgi:5S rRNA maturation endonuclease (ribonuclease M5)